MNSEEHEGTAIEKRCLTLEFDEALHWLDTERQALNTAIATLQGKRDGVNFAIDLVEKEKKEFMRRNGL